MYGYRDMQRKLSKGFYRKLYRWQLRLMKKRLNERDRYHAALKRIVSEGGVCFDDDDERECPICIAEDALKTQ